MPASVPMAVLTVLAGLAALFPVRRDLGPVAYHLAAWPVGLVAWPVVALVTTVFRTPYTVPLVVAVVVLYAAAVAAGMLAFKRTAANGETVLPVVPWWSYAVHVAALASAGWWVLSRRMSAASFDAFMFYEPYGIWLSDTGRITVPLVSERAFMLPSLHAAAHAFGGEWPFALYTLTAFYAVAGTAALAWRFGTAHLSLLPRLAIIAGVVALMYRDPSLQLHAVYVHSHSITALFLLLAIGGLLAAAFAASPGSARQAAFSALGGIGALGVVLTRPDGLAYAFVPVVICLALSIGTRFDLRAATAFFAPLLLGVFAAYGMMLAGYGIWSAPRKLSGRAALAILVLLVMAAAVPFIIERIPRVRAWLGSGATPLRLLLLLDVLAITYVLSSRTETFVQAASNALMNLFLLGGHGTLWVLWFGVAGIWTVFSLWRRAEWAPYLFVAVVQFFVVAALVHGVAHTGRLGWGDSLNRVVIHSVPLMFWFTAAAVGLALRGRPFEGTSVEGRVRYPD